MVTANLPTRTSQQPQYRPPVEHSHSYAKDQQETHSNSLEESQTKGVTLGGTGKEVGDRHPKIGQGALIGAGATILGNIIVGEGAMIAAGSLVLKNVPSHSMSVGNPAKTIGYLDEEDPSLTMKHDATKGYFEKLAISSTDRKSNGICRHTSPYI